MGRVNNNCLKCFLPEENLCYDECMVKYFGRHRCKQYIRGKPIRFGYKIWSLNAPSAYLVNFEKYQGNNPRRSLEYEKNFGKSAAPLVAMLEELKEAKGFLPHILFFDNLFTGLSLIKYLRDNGVQGTGTLRENRIQSYPIATKSRWTKNREAPTNPLLTELTALVLFGGWIIALLRQPLLVLE
jgi:hypothetical protein